MKMLLLCSGLLFCLLTGSLAARDRPKTEISNGVVRAVIMLPDAERGAYQGTRFDWSGFISSLRYAGHDYIAPWRVQDDPKFHSAITGPAEVFVTSPGYDQTKPGGAFIRIGVGILRKPGEKAFSDFYTYDIVNPGRWKVRQGKNWIEFTQELASEDGYAYFYRKTLRLKRGKPELVIEHSFKNIGQKIIDTDEFCHNFFLIDREIVGPDLIIRFSFDPRPASPLTCGAEVRGRNISFAREFQEGDVVYTQLGGVGSRARDFNVRIENRKSAAGVRISGSRPLTKLQFWAIRTVACPETYIHLHVQPGGEASWKTRYDFYTMGSSANESQR